MTTTMFDAATVRRDFPILSRQIDGKPIVYLDSAASAQQPQSVIDAVSHYSEYSHANVHRGVYGLAEEATSHYEEARRKVGRFLGAPDPMHEVIFVKNTTEGLNLVANSWGRANLGPGDAVVLTEMEHHANLVPWLMLSQQFGFTIRYLEVDPDGRLVLDNLDAILDGAKLLSVTGVSNVLGTINPLALLAQAAHRHGALINVDGAQQVPHMATDVAALDLDFLSFSGHKLIGPTGIGVLWGRAELLDAMPPFLGGGGMILDVKLDSFRPAEPPHRFEAGTPPIAEAVGLGAAVDYLENLTMEAVREHDRGLTAYTLDLLDSRFGADLRVFGPRGEDRCGVFSLAYKDIHAHDLAQVLDQYGVCVRPGHHCAKPLMRKLGLPATARASLGCYNEERDIDALVEAIAQADKLFS